MQNQTTTDNPLNPSSSGPSEYRSEAYPLVLYNPNSNKFEVNEETRDFLRKLEGPIGVISVAGMYRTGKSYLLNRMLLNQSRGFDVGPTINACTKGVWIWGRPIEGQTPEGDAIKVLVLDTEGLGALDEDSNHDVRIFSLAILLSSYFIYNSVGSIDENALQQLSLVINLTKHIQIKSGSKREETDPEEFAQYFPSFMWVVRDFTLQLLDSEQEPITSKEYLEKALSNQKGFSEAVEQKNRIRRLLKSFFKERDCCTMIRPLTKEDELQNLADMELEKLRPEFVEQIQSLRRKVIMRIKAKQINGRKLNGEMLFNLASSYVEAINKGAVPSIESSWSYICKNECLKATQESFELFERQFYDAFQKQVPLSEDELTDIYKACKRAALTLFNRTAVGEVRDTFLSDLKEKMRQKLQHMRVENEKQSEHMCLMFLEQEYQVIANKLRNSEYGDLESFNMEIHDFEQFYLENGPKGPYRKEIGLEFCYNKLVEGADFYNRSLQYEFNLQVQINEENQKKLKCDLLEHKQESQKQIAFLDQRLRDLEKEKAELSAKEQTTREHLQQVRAEKERADLEAEQRVLQLRKEAQLNEESLRQKIDQQDVVVKESMRRQLQAESEFDKQKALADQQNEFITQKCQALEQREKELMAELKSQKQDTSTQKQEQKAKYEAQLQDLQKAKELLQEQLYDIESKNSSLEQHLSQQCQKALEQEQSLQREVQKFREQAGQLQRQLDELKLKFESELSQYTQQSNCDLVEAQERASQLDQLLKECEEEHDSLKSKFEKEQAVASQRLEFLQVQLEQERNQRQEDRRNHDRMLKTIQNSQRESVIGKEEAAKARDDLQQQFQEQLTEMQRNYDEQLCSKEAEKRELAENCQRLELELQVSEADRRKENELLRENLQSTESDFQRLQEVCKGLEQQKKALLDEMQTRHSSKVQELEAELEENERQHDLSMQELAHQSEEQLQQLRHFYEADKQRLEQRFSDEKERAAQRMNDLVREQEQHLRDEQQQHEDELEMVKMELAHTVDESKQVIAQYENELSLLNQTNEAVNRYYAETKDALDRQQQSHAQQIDQLQQKLNSERRELTAKVDALTTELTRKERVCTTLENQKESFQNTIAQKEKQLTAVQQDAAKDRAENQTRLSELKAKLEEKEDELTQKKIDFERQTALNQQQILFTEQKANDLSVQIERTVHRYEERIKMDREEMQREIKEKSQKFQVEKENAEAKFEAKRKQVKELEQRLQRELANSEREKDVLIMKQQNLENQHASLQRNLEAQLHKLREENQVLGEQIQADGQVVQQELDRARKECVEMERQLQDAHNNYDKEKALWDGRFKFLEQQRDQSKRDMEEASQKFQATVDQLQKVQSDSKHKTDATHTIMMQQLQSQLNQRLKEASEQHQGQVYELSQKLKQVEREKAALNERLELASRDQQQDLVNLTKKNDKQKDQIERLQDELDGLKRERDAKVSEYQQRLEKEREVFNQKKRELDQRSSKIESNQTAQLLKHEGERAKWDQQLTDTMHQRDEYKSEADRLRMKVDSLVKDVEVLKQQVKNQRKSIYTAGQQSQGVSGAGYTSAVNKFSLPQRTSGFTPGMYQSARTGVTSGEQQQQEGGQPDGQLKFKPRFGAGMSSVKEVNQSVEFSSKLGKGMLSQSLAMQKGKAGFASNLGGNTNNNNASGGRGADVAAVEESLDTSALHKNLLSTPSSKNDDTDLVHQAPASDHEE